MKSIIDTIEWLGVFFLAAIVVILGLIIGGTMRIINKLINT